MNKLGFYIENSTVPFIREALALIKPPVILFHAGDRGLLREIRTSLSPDSFIIGRLFVTWTSRCAGWTPMILRAPAPPTPIAFWSMILAMPPSASTAACSSTRGWGQMKRCQARLPSEITS
ncbi:MAG: hypothetical protein IPO15_04940 [Anaerolineae bacterium]|uniref:hypothetical protein n=1 Tax=Candidatus Amarolinea dominans TaxID=3140696 RepID=UPI0031361E3E|nr:hypothetical protein [Anaerolineae bacterium]